MNIQKFSSLLTLGYGVIVQPSLLAIMKYLALNEVVSA